MFSLHWCWLQFCLVLTYRVYLFVLLLFNCSIEIVWLSYIILIHFLHLYISILPYICVYMYVDMLYVVNLWDKFVKDRFFCCLYRLNSDAHCFMVIIFVRRHVCSISLVHSSIQRDDRMGGLGSCMGFIPL